ncbi:hypothetical protein F2Q70_00031301 [Brassica cretica]|uniref:Uncharacterized protein n=1 Tax=Brassica cretica TaxID=69181 RepID=A0A8S9FLS1_BRACR|nr:hypothetical protein F2Q70_00031301 [Brassica cretica]
MNYFYHQRRFIAEVGIESHVPFLFYDALRSMPSWCDGLFIVLYLQLSFSSCEPSTTPLQMAASDGISAELAAQHTTFDDLGLGRPSQVITFTLSPWLEQPMKLTKLPKKDAASGPRGGPSPLTVNSSYVSMLQRTCWQALPLSDSSDTLQFRSPLPDLHSRRRCGCEDSFRGESNNRAPQVVSQSEQPPASASDPVDAATKVMAVDQPTPPSFGGQVANATLSESWKCSKL